MTLVDQVAERLVLKVPSLAGRIGKAGDLAALMDAGSLPQGNQAAFIVPLGFRAGEVTAATGLHSQSLARRVAIILVIRFAGNPTGAKTIPEVDQLERETLRAIAGWKPNGAWDAFAVERGALLGLKPGVAFFEIDFTISELLRIHA